MKLDKEKSGLARRSLATCAPKLQRRSGEGGQALLIIVLIMVVALTVGLSLGSRTIINIRTSSEEADSQKALAAAEAGIEQAIQTNTTIPLTTFIENNTTYDANVTEVRATAGTAFLANGGNLVVQDDGVDVWLVSHNQDGTPNYGTTWNGNLDIYWGDESLADCSNPAIEVAVISRNPTPPPDFQLKRYAYDPCVSRRLDNKFSPPSKSVNTIKGKKFPYNIVGISVSSGLVARVVPIYNSTVIAVEGNSALPTQGFAIDSTGISGSGNRQVQRSLTFFRTFDQVVISQFMYGLFTP